jgi:hypothetical protein
MVAHASLSALIAAAFSSCCDLHSLMKTLLFKRAASSHAFACILAAHRFFAFGEEQISIKLKSIMKKGQKQGFKEWISFCF